MELKNVFGEVGKGIHKYRFGPFAAVDLFGTIIIAWFFANYYKYNFIIVLLCLFLLGIVLHRLFGIQTPVDKWIKANIV